MILRLFLLFTIIPTIEIFLLIRVGRLIGPFPTIGLLLLLSALGAWLVRSQGFAILRRIQDELARGRLPATELFDGALVLAGGLLLMTPGFFTDILGLVLLIPRLRIGVRALLRRWLQRRLDRGMTVVIRRF